MDSSNVSQNNCSSRCSRGTATKATGWVGADRAAQARSSEVLPLPAGAEMTVSFRATARSSAATSRSRSTRRVPLVLQSAACSAVTTLALRHWSAVYAHDVLRHPGCLGAGQTDNDD